MSYSALLRRAADYAALYRREGLSAGDRVVIALRHSVDLYAAFVGALLGGFVPAMFPFPSPKTRADDYRRSLAALFDNARPHLFVTYPDLADKCQSAGLAPAGLRMYCTDEPLPPGSPDRIGAEPSPDDTAFLQYSSGTTGLKKGVAISHRALLWQVDQYARAIRLTPRDRIVSWLPLYHDMGLIACLMTPLLHRVPLVALCPFEWVRRPASWLHAASIHRATLSWLPNFAYSFLARSVRDEELRGVDLSSLRGVVNCSEPILDASHVAFLRRFEPYGLRASALAASYALAENTFAATSGGFGDSLVRDIIDGVALARDGHAVPCSPESPTARVLVSSGRALPETEIAIVNEHGAELPERRVGEIVLRSPCLLREYYRNPDATRVALRGGRYFTGDAGYIADGELFVIGRLRDLIVIRGQNIYPQDIEAIVNDVRGVIPGRVAAVAVDNDALGTRDLVVLAETHETDAKRRERIRSQIRERIAAATEVAPADVRLFEHMWLRKSTSGKISRSINRERYLALRDENGGASHDTCGAHETNDAARSSKIRASKEVADADATLQRVRRCVNAVIGDGRRAGASLDDHGALITSGTIDSLRLAELIAAIEAEFDVSIPPAALAEISKIDTIAAWSGLIERLTTIGRDERRPTQSLDSSESRVAVPRRPEDVVLRTGEPRAVRRASGFWTRYYRWVFWRRGVRCGRGLRVLGPLLLRIDGSARNIEIGDNVTLMPGVDLKVRENGRIILHDGVVLDTGARLVAANDARIELGEDAQIAMGCIINAGADVIIGARTAVAGYCTIIASEHRYLGPEPFMRQGYDHTPVYIGQDVWIATHALINRGSRIGDGAVISAGSIVKGDVPPRAVVAGRPARVIRFRAPATRSVNPATAGL
ncbi:MAG: hypothetical protein D6744_16075 [Planctomycetota bacterium]|nr:MAG: hypothetical protein D6744_16075 [Planctomycetota bacterium]